MGLEEAGNQQMVSSKALFEKKLTSNRHLFF